MRIFVTGAHGQLGRALAGALTGGGHTVVATDVDTVDITDARAVTAAIAAAAPDAVAHIAALTDVDGCARAPERARVVNALGTRNVALACQPRDVPLLYISSNEVFDGTRTTPYGEWDCPHPINPYGYSKWAGEEYVRWLTRRFYIVRTAWLFAAGGHNFVHKILARAAEIAAGRGDALRVVTDEISNPTYVPDLVRALTALLETGLYGVYHLVNAGQCSRYTFARRALDLAGYAGLPITPITLAHYSRPSTPPAYSALENFAGREAGIELRPWEAALAEFISSQESGVRSLESGVAGKSDQSDTPR